MKTPLWPFRNWHFMSGAWMILCWEEELSIGLDFTVR
jgi:hypothetical protein